jgi:hypothetical protein
MQQDSKVRSLALLIGLMLLGATVLAFGQVAGGSISGVVKDRGSAVIPGAKVTLQGTKSSKSVETVTDSEGRFKFIPPDIYQLRVEHSEFKAATKESIVVIESRNTEIDFRLETPQACDDASSGSTELTDSDKEEIVRLVLVEALVEKKIPDYLMLVENKKAVVVSTLNFKKAWVPTLPDYTLKLMSPAEIQSQADAQGDFLYLSFDEFKVKGSCVAVTLVNSWAVGKKSGMGYLSGGGFSYEYRKQSGKWVGKWISGWIS